MNYGFLASFIVFAILFYFNTKRHSNERHDEEKAFWARESKANSVRRKSLDGLKYIRIPVEDFPTHLLSENTSVADCIEIVKSLAALKVVNLTGWSNTDLKLEYGAANITELSEYDQNYTLLASTLQKWADLLIEAGYMKEAAVLMEFAVSTETDVSRTYYQLADYWISQGESFQIEHLIRTAEGLRSVNRDAILRHLHEKYQP